MSNNIIAELTSLKSTPTAELKAKWRELFGSEPPAYNRQYLIGRLSYRIQELRFGGLRPEVVARLDAIADEIEGTAKHRPREQLRYRPVAGTRLIREWRGVEHCVLVREQDFEYDGRPFKSLSAVAGAITGSKWNGWIFFGLTNPASVK
jgi:hypothetical protein